MSLAEEQFTKAKQLAGHQEEPTGHVCRSDCEGCNDPIGQMSRIIQQLRTENWILRRHIKTAAVAAGLMEEE